MDKNDFDLDFDFEKEYGIDPNTLGDQDFDGDMDFGDDFLSGEGVDFDLNDPIFDEEPRTAPAPASVPEPAPQDDLDLSGLDLGDIDVDDISLDDLDLDGLDLEDPAPEYTGDELPPLEEELPPLETELPEEPAPVPQEMPVLDEEPAPAPVRRRETRRERNQRIRKFKTEKLPRIIAMVAAGFLLFFVAGSIIRGFINGAADRQAQAEAEASAQLAAQAQEAEAKRLLEEADVLAAGYNYEGAIEKLDSFSGELSAYPEMVSKRSEYAQMASQMVAWSDPSKIPNLSFHMLIADPSRAFTAATYGKKYNQNFVTVDEFQKILQQLYDNGYVLVSMEDVYKEVTSESGVTTYEANTIYLPQGKKPIMITETLANYLSYMIDSNNDGEADAGGAGFASRLVLENGEVKAEMVTSTGETVVGDYDLVPILNSFIEKNPDFSYCGARAVLAVCGYEGIFGYRINASVASDKGQDYYNEQVSGAKEIVAALKADGYEIACYTYANIGYGTHNATEIKTDLTKWSQEILPVLGEVDILVYAQSSEIEDYTSSKYNVLYSSGFRYFINSGTTTWAEVNSSYVRMSRLMVTGTNMAYYSNLFSSYFDSMSVLNSSRGTVPN